MENSNFNELSQSISPDVRGIIWLTQDQLTFDSPAASDINHLLDGNLFNSLRANSNELKHNFFLAKSFGQDFFVAHTCADKNIMTPHLPLFQNLIKETDSVIILDCGASQTQTTLIKEIKKHYPNLTVNIFNFKG